LLGHQKEGYRKGESNVLRRQSQALRNTITQRHESALEIRSPVKTKVPKIEFHAYPARTDGHIGKRQQIAIPYRSPNSEKGVV
jgi:hypothetical protein